MFASICLAAACTPDITPRPGMKITATCRFRPGTYLAPASDTGPAILIRGSRITVDFRGAVLEGTDPKVAPDHRVGTGVDLVGTNITIKNAVIRGYKVGLIARKALGLKLINCDFSYNWKQHLRSTLEHEDESDWQSYHNNEHEEWLRYGAGAYLQDCSGFEIRGCRATGGQCGLMLTRCNHGKVWNNDCSFMSGLGIGLYRSSDNVVMHNKFDWCVRGFSYGVYNRGQDSAGILVYEQSSRNLFAYNSATHGGDGFFLWAGQHTMDTGKGGCNDNLVYGNDFSHSPANGIEATFSRNTFVHNLCVECDYGLWGGYSCDTTVLDNGIAACRVGAAFEHSQNCSFSMNNFVHCKQGIQLWGTGKPDPNWGYGKGHDVRSTGNSIKDEHFLDVPGPAIWLRDTSDVTLADNQAVGQTKGIDAVGASFKRAGALKVSPGPPGVDWLDKKEYPADLRVLIDGWSWKSSGAFNAFRPKPLVGGQNAYLPEGALRGRRYMLVDEWGPYDFRFPRVWPRGENANGDKIFEVLGPKGKWKVQSVTGATVVGARSGITPAFVTVRMPSGVALDVKLTLQFVGASVTDYRGITTPAGKPVIFTYSQFFAPIAWNIGFFKWDKTTDPRTEEPAFRRLLAGPPIATSQGTKLEFNGYGAWAPGVPDNYFAISATGDFTVSAGKYALEVTTDDGCRLDLDGKPLQLYDSDGKAASAFHYQGPTPYTAPLTLSGGKHRLHVEYFQIDGYKTIQVHLKKGVP
ncbi:MAG: right-handed parallel beta-helix repeat-containing protein [Fimbriimonadaceae bacterium]